MSLLGNVINYITRIDSRYGQSVIPGSSLTRPTYIGQFGGMPVYPDPKVERFIQAYSENASVFSIVNLAARKFSFIPRYLMKEEDEQAAKSYKSLLRSGQWQKAKGVKKRAYTGKDTETAIDKLLKKPNPVLGQDLFFFAIYVSYKICGEAFVWLNRGEVDDSVDDDIVAKMPVLEMYWIPANLVESIPDPDDVYGITGYYFNSSAKGRSFIRKVDMIHWKTFNPNFDETTRPHLRGLPPLKAGNKILTQDEDSTSAAVAMYQNGGARGLLFEKSLKNITPDQKAKLENITAKRLNNKDLKSSIANAQGDWGYIDIGKDSVDMQLLEAQDKAFAKICHLFGVPPGLFLIDQTYENQRSNRKRMLSELIIPDCASFNDEMNRVLLPAFGLSGYKIEPDYSELPEMQEDMRDMITYLKDSPITLNEFRDALGYDPINIEEMDKVLIDSNKIPVEDISEVDEILMNGQGNRTNGVSKVPDNGQGKKLQN